MNIKPTKTLNEQKAEIQKNLEIAERQKILEQQLAESKERSRIEQLPLTTALKGLGFDVDSVWSLSTRYKGKYVDAIPVLFEHFDKPYSPGVTQGIAIAFGFAGTAKHWDRLCELYQKEPLSVGKNVNGPKEALAGTLAKLVDRKTLPDLIRLVQNKENGISRVLLLSPLRRRLKNKEIKELVDELAYDSDLDREIESWPNR